MRSRVLFLAVLMGCRSKPTPSPPQPDPAIAAPAVVDASMTDAAKPDASRPRSTEPAPSNVVDLIAVSSRVDNTTESPAALVDGNLDTAWSSKTDDLEGAWVALHVRPPVDVTAVLLTVGMTKSADLFVQNPRISEVSISWAPLGPKDVVGPAKVIVEHAALDIESRALQRIPISAPGYGVLTITVRKLTMGTKPSWRETTISEVGLEGPSGARLGISLREALVGSFHPKPRGALGIVPEQRAPLGCTALLPDGPRFYCFLGFRRIGDEVSTDELVTADSTGFTSVASLDQEGKIDYGAWLRAERAAKGARPLNEKKAIPWQGTLDLAGITLRQRELKHVPEDTGVGNWELFDGALEIRWPGASDFAKVFDDAIATTEPNEAHAMRIGNWLLVERLLEHGSEGRYWSGADAALCDVTKKTCTVHTEREVDAGAP